DPVAEHALAVLLPAPDIARHGAIDHDRELDGGVVGADLRPVRVELLLGASGECRHLSRIWIGLVFEENVEVPVFDRPESHLGCYLADFGHNTLQGTCPLLPLPDSQPELGGGRVLLSRSLLDRFRELPLILRWVGEATRPGSLTLRPVRSA